MVVTVLAAVVLLIACVATVVTVYSVMQAKKAILLVRDGGMSQVQPLPPGHVIRDQEDFKDVNGERIPLPISGNKSWLLVFLSAECPGCNQQLGRFRRYLTEHGLPADRVISVVMGERSALAKMTERLADVSQVVHVDEASSLMTTLHIAKWPTYVMVGPGGRVAFSSQSVSRFASLDSKS
ncbi:hypothetical protein ABT072_43000 [Streptomyces sp. NPDC002589]|uniref:peroxiredoxin family protein n=1 Tax=Streptomyces sp. NPDC002589 TaxID=3154420 RepID=UPI00332A40D7